MHESDQNSWLMLSKKLKIYKTNEIHERRRNDIPGPAKITLERSTRRCSACEWNKYDLMCSRYLVYFRKDILVMKGMSLSQLCMGQKGYALRSIKRNDK